MQNYAKAEIEKLLTNIITETVGDVHIDDVFVVNKNANDEINDIDFNSNKINSILSLLNKELEERIDFYQDKVVFYIPSLLVTNSSLLANLGPKIPVKFMSIGNVKSNIKTEVKNYGINNALITAYLDVIVTCKVILPITELNVDVNQEINVAMKLIHGKIPSYYFGGIEYPQ